jgi:hypothetical protein
MTFLFASKHFAGPLAANDDLDEIRWFQIDEIFEKREKMVVRKHLPLFIALEKWLLAKKLRLDAAPRQLA